MKFAHVLHTLTAVNANGFELLSPSTMEQIISWISDGNCLQLLLLKRLLGLGFAI